MSGSVGLGSPVATLVDRHTDTLSASGVATPRVDAEILAAHVLGLPRAALRTSPMPDDARLERLDRLVRERAVGVPVQLLTGETWFRHLRLDCRPGVFIPRPETEIVAGHAIAAARTVKAAPRIADLCTGAGPIALAVASEVVGAQVIGIDDDPAAVALARHNLGLVRSGRAGVAGLAADAACRFVRGDLFDALAPELRGRLDVVVSNPPYLPDHDRDDLPIEVRGHDPAAALFGGRDGHEIVDAVLAGAAMWLDVGGTAIIEIDERRREDALASARRAGLVDARVERDLTGADRCLIARRPTWGRRS